MPDDRAGRQTPESARQARHFVPTLDDPPLQELAREWGDPEDYGWRVLVLCVLLNRAGRAQALQAAGALFRRWPSPDDLASAPLWRIEDEIRCCGFQAKRAQTLALLSLDWRRRRQAVLDGRQPVDGLPGCGRYAADAFALFVDGDLEREPEDLVLAAWRDLVRTTKDVSSPSRGADDTLESASVGNTQTKEATMASSTEINPRDLTVGQSVRIDSVKGEVEKVDKKGGRLTIATESGPCQIKFRDVVEVEILSDDDAVGDDEKKALQEELDALKGNMQGWTAQESARVKVIRERLGLDSEAKAKATKKGSATGQAKKPSKRAAYPEEITEAVRLAKAARGTTNGAPGAKQHQALRLAVAAAITADGEGATTPAEQKAAILSWLGMTEKALKDAASGKMATEKLRQQDGLRKVAQLDALQDPKIKPWIGGRNGASILTAWIAQLGR